MPDPGNPAGRLYIILSEARNNIPTPDTRNVSQLASMFGINTKVTGKAEIEVLHRLLELLRLVDETVEAINKIPMPNKEPYLRPIPHIKTTIMHLLGNLQGKWAVYHQEIVKIDFVALEFCSTKLSEYPTEPPMKQADFDEILKDVQDLCDDVNRDGMPPELRMFILDLMESVRQAIAEYRIRGVERLREVLSHIAGRVYTNLQIAEAPENLPQMGKLNSIWLKIKQGVEFVSSITKIGESVTKFLGPGGH